VTIDPDVRGVAKEFGVDAALLQAVVKAEGNIVAAVKCSIPNLDVFAQQQNRTSREYALRVLARSCAHAMSDYIKGSDPLAFVRFWGARWAPVGAANDPKGLNQFWPKNVEKLWVA
jgi:hypothetical protein